MSANRIGRSCPDRGCWGWYRAYAVALVTILLAGCSTTQPLIPVATACIGKMPPSPIYTTDSDLKGMTPGDRYLSIAADRLALIAAYDELRSVAEPCSK